MNKIVTSLSCLILLPSFLAFSAEEPAIDVAKLLAQKQEWHKDLIAKDSRLVDVYEDYIYDISELNGNGDVGLNQMYGKCRFESGRLAYAINNEGQEMNIPVILEEQSKLIKEGLALTKNRPELNLKIKYTADCLCRMVQQKFPSYSLDFTQEPPFREKNEKEKQSNTENLDHSKRAILKSRMVYRTYTGWMTAVCTPFAACLDYIAIKKPSILTCSLAAVATLWTGYNGWAYNHIKNLPYPSDEKVYKMWATNLNPKFD